MERRKAMSWSFWARVSCISWNLKTDGTVGHGRSEMKVPMNNKYTRYFYTLAPHTRMCV